jgi:hypothetical protein
MDLFRIILVVIFSAFASRATLIFRPPKIMSSLRRRIREYWCRVANRLDCFFDDRHHSMLPFLEMPLEERMDEFLLGKWQHSLATFIHRYLAVPKGIVKELVALLERPHQCPPFDLKSLHILIERYLQSQSFILPLADRMSRYINHPYVKDEKTGQRRPLRPDEPMIPQWHAGRHVLAHSIWTAAQIYEWHLERSPFIDLDIDLREAILAGFLHDIAKVSHCAQTSLHGKHWLDPYSPAAYGGKGAHHHSVVSGDILLGLTPFFWSCPPKFSSKIDDQLAELEEWKRGHPQVLGEDLFRNLNVDRKIMALTGYMHWELGVINLNYHPKEKRIQALNDYLNKFEYYSRRCGMAPTLQNVKKCLLISLADIRGSFPIARCRDEKDCSPMRTKLIEDTVPILAGIALIFDRPIDTNAYYSSKRGWFRERMNERALSLREEVLAYALLRGYSRYHQQLRM